MRTLSKTLLAENKTLDIYLSSRRCFIFHCFGLVLELFEPRKPYFGPLPNFMPGAKPKHNSRSCYHGESKASIYYGSRCNQKEATSDICSHLQASLHHRYLH